MAYDCNKIAGLLEAAELLLDNSESFQMWVNGDEEKEVELGGKNTPSIRRLVKIIDERESKAAKVVIDAGVANITKITNDGISEITEIRDTGISIIDRMIYDFEGTLAGQTGAMMPWIDKLSTEPGFDTAVAGLRLKQNQIFSVIK